LEVKDGRLRDHHMDILELIERNKEEASMNDTRKQVAAKAAPVVVKSDDRNSRKDQEKELRKLKTQVQRCEQELGKLEGEQKDLQGQLNNGTLDTKGMEQGYTRLGELTSLIDSCMREWERAGSDLEALTKEVV